MSKTERRVIPLSNPDGVSSVNQVNPSIPRLSDPKGDSRTIGRNRSEIVYELFHNNLLHSHSERHLKNIFKIFQGSLCSVKVTTPRVI